MLPGAHGHPQLRHFGKKAIPASAGERGWLFCFSPTSTGYPAPPQPPSTIVGGASVLPITCQRDTGGHQPCNRPGCSVPWRQTSGWGTTRISPSPVGEAAAMDLSTHTNSDDEAGRGEQGCPGELLPGPTKQHS